MRRLPSTSIPSKSQKTSLAHHPMASRENVSTFYNVDPCYNYYAGGPFLPRLQITYENLFVNLRYSIVKDSSADLGVNSKIVQNRPTVKAVCTKISIF